jgi:hypothetical protein
MMRLSLCSAGIASRRSKRSSASRFVISRRDCSARSTHATNSRSGRPRLIRRFRRDFPDAVDIRLEENFRSTGHILAAANAIIAEDKARLDEAKAMLMKAVAAVKADKAKALDMFNKGEGGFLDRDLYVFCDTLSDPKNVAIGNPKRQAIARQGPKVPQGRCRQAVRR